MRWSRSAAAILFALCCAEPVLGKHVLHMRDDPTPASTSASPVSAKETPSKTDATSQPASKTDTPSSTAASSGSASSISSTPSPSPTASSNATMSSTTGLVTSTSLPLNGTTAEVSDDLPIEPIITPAMAIAGVLLMLSGSTLCLVGIKHKSVHVFLSTGLLTALAVSVLIIYVMNPPVSNAIQGAYMVAAVVTGLVFGGIAIVFKEVTEGLGCLLGGFCLAMWFLTLKDGGLIGSTAGRAILIAAFAIVAFTLSFSQYTRNYGLIAFTAFAGAQVAIIGIDCFSRAGLKEFWIYLWALNSNEFPLDTTTYPITRGIRVELACSVVCCIFGVLSQLKIWKIVKERRDKREAERLQDDEDRDILERELGSKIEKSNRRDLRRWENLYGNRNGGDSETQFDSGVGSSIHTSKKSASIHAKEVDDIELANMPGIPVQTSKRDSGPIVTIRASSDVERVHLARLPENADQDYSVRSLRRESTQQEAYGGEGLVGKTLSPRSSHNAMRNSAQSQTISPQSSHDMLRRTSVQDKSLRQSGPAVVPLPFVIPQDVDEAEMASDNESIASKSQRHSAMQGAGADLRANIPHIDEDQATSVAANADDIANLETLSQHRLSMFPSPYDTIDEDGKATAGFLDLGDSSKEANRQSFIEAPVEENDDEAVIRPPTVIAPSRSASVAKMRPESNLSLRSKQRFSVDSNGALTENPNGGTSVVGSLHGHLPTNMSKVAMTFRTNEWAKHIADADEPDELEPEPSSPGIKVDPVFAEETARPVDVEDLQETRPQPEVYEPQRSASQLSSPNPYRNSWESRPGTAHRDSAGSVPTPVYAFGSKKFAGSQPVLNRSTSNNSLRQDGSLQRVQRSVTSPIMVEPITEMPISEAALARAPVQSRKLGSLPLGSTSNLLDERNDRIRAMPRTTSFNALTSASTPNVNLITPCDVASIHESIYHESPQEMISPADSHMTFDAEDMTLAQRKALIRANSRSQSRGPNADDLAMSPTSQHMRRISLNSYSGTPVRIRSNSQMAGMNNQALIYDSHQPSRGKGVDTIKQANMLAQWRQSLEQSSQQHQPVVMNDNAHNTMLLERRQNEWAAQQRQAEHEHRQSAIDMAMRTGQMNNAHRDAMRRMQAKANRESQA